MIGQINSPKLYQRNCMVCNKNNKKNFFKSDFYETFSNGDFFYKKNSYDLCQNCLFIYRNPDVSNYYRKKIYSNLAIEDPKKKNSLRSKVHFKMFKQLIRKSFLNQNSRILEIGCGTGALLKNIINKYNLNDKNIYGTEISKILIKYLQNNNFHVFENLNKIIKSELTFDLIILDNVFEHFEKPYKELKKIKHLLKQNGKVYCSIPNILKTRINISDPLNHECNYILSNFKYVIESSGFKIEKYKYSHFWLNSLISLGNKNKVNFNLKNKKSLAQINIIKNILKMNNLQNRLIFKKISKLKNSKVILYGAGNHTLAFLNMFINLNIKVIYLCDSNKSLFEKKRFGFKIINPEKINKINYDKIIISSRAFQNEIYTKLINMKINKKKIFLIYE